jgi:hypothetical protein
MDHLNNPQCLDGCFNRPVVPFPVLNHDSGIPYTQALAVGQKSAIPDLQSMEWQPRVSFAYSPSIFHDSLVFRGGYGIFYDAFPSVLLDQLSLSPPLFNSFTVSAGGNGTLAPGETNNVFDNISAINSAFVDGVSSGKTVAQIKSSLPTTIQPFFAPPSLASLDQGQTKLFNVNKWNLEIQKELPARIVLSINYVGNHGVHRAIPNSGLNAYANSANANYAGLAGLPAAAPDARFGKVYTLQTNGNTSYNGLIVSGGKHFGPASLISASWVWSKAMDTASPGITRNTTVSGSDITSIVDPYHPQASYAASLYDMRHYFSANYLYTTPFRNLFLGGWQISGTTFIHTGQAFSVYDNTVTNSISGTAASGGNYGGTILAHYNGTPKIPCSRPETVCLTKSMFSSSSLSSFTRNNFYGPGYVEFDVAVLKQISLSRLHEGAKFEFGAQAFNVANHANFARPNANIGSASTFGKITSTVGTATSIFGGVGGDASPRLVQIKGKLIF